MTVDLASEVRKISRNAFAYCALTDATDPHHSQNISAQLGIPHTTITEEEVLRRLGPEIAEKWVAMRDAVREYRAAIREDN